MQAQPVRPGRALKLLAGDYLYGKGPLTIRVVRIDWNHPEYVAGKTWFPVEGIRLSATGVAVDRVRVWVRTRRLHHLP